MWFFVCLVMIMFLGWLWRIIRRIVLVIRLFLIMCFVGIVFWKGRMSLFIFFSLIKFIVCRLVWSIIVVLCCVVWVFCIGSLMIVGWLFYGVWLSLLVVGRCCNILCGGFLCWYWWVCMFLEMKVRLLVIIVLVWFVRCIFIFVMMFWLWLMVFCGGICFILMVGYFCVVKRWLCCNWVRVWNSRFLILCCSWKNMVVMCFICVLCLMLVIFVWVKILCFLCYCVFWCCWRWKSSWLWLNLFCLK